MQVATIEKNGFLKVDLLGDGGGGIVRNGVIHQVWGNSVDIGIAPPQIDTNGRGFHDEEIERIGVQLEPGDVVFLWTDGLAKYFTDNDGEKVSSSREVLDGLTGNSPKESLLALIKKVSRGDDIAAAAFVYEGE